MLTDQRGKFEVQVLDSESDADHVVRWGGLSNVHMKSNCIMTGAYVGLGLRAALIGTCLAIMFVKLKA